MGAQVRAQRRDGNEPELITAARKLGWYLTALHTPCDYLGLYRGLWRTIEVKEKTGKLTKAQKVWHSEVHARGGDVLIWRTLEDVLACTDGVDNWRGR